MRTALSRIFLVGLIGVAVFALVRLATGASGALVAFDGLSADGLDHRAFALSAPATLAIDAAGPYEEAGTPAADTTLAAYGWIVRREDGAVVWRLRAPRPDRGTLVQVADTVRLPEGTYDAYFTSHGDPLVRDASEGGGSLAERVRDFLSRGGRSWVGDAGRWRFEVDVVGEDRHATDDVSPSDPADADPDLGSLGLWQTRGVPNRAHREVLLHVTRPAEVTVRAVTEATDGVIRDVPSIARLGRRDTVWTASAEGSAWAGGSLKNRVVQDRVRLKPGIYVAAFDADRSHGYDGWAGNPPWRPAEWGMAVSRASAADAVSLLDPDALDLPVVASYECVGPDQDRQTAFTLSEPADLLVVAVGEIESGSRYDYATLDRLEGSRGRAMDWDRADWDEVWEMRDGLEPAGGADKNRRAVRALALEPGTYRLRYRSDGSHDCQSGYNDAGGPDAPLWGAVLYALDPDAAPASFDAVDISRVDEEGTSYAEAPAFPASDPLAAIDGVGDDQDLRSPFALDAPTDVRVIAAGELSTSRGFDYASIEQDGRTVWEMTYDNTVAASGDSYHRLFDGTVALGAGRYTLRYRSDGSRSAGDFGPSSEALWGARVYALAPAPPPPPAPPGPPPPGVTASPELVGGPDAVQDVVVYPADARREGVGGTVVLRLTIDVDGRAGEPEVVESPDPRLTEAAISAVQQVRFRPGTRDGRPERATTLVPVRFGRR